MLGIIGFENHRISCIIGVNPQERLHEQEILISLQMEVDIQRACYSDEVVNTICYAEAAGLCTEIAQKGRFHLLEKLAYELVTQLTSLYELSWIKVKIRKPSAIPTASCAFVELEKGKRGE